MSLARRRAALSFGRRGETLAAWWLRCKGYRILARDFRAKVGEIDLIARRGGTLALVEVKARQSDAAAAEAVRPEQRRRVARAAQAFVQRHPALSALRLRFDVIFIVPGKMPRHVPDAWRQEPPGGA